MRSLGLGGNKNKTAAGGAARTTAQLSIAALVLGFVFLSWCVLVGGLSAVQHKGTQAEVGIAVLLARPVHVHAAEY